MKKLFIHKKKKSNLGIKIRDLWNNTSWTVSYKLKTTEMDGAMVPLVTESMGVATSINCNKCLHPGEHDSGKLYFAPLFIKNHPKKSFPRGS